MDIYSLKIRQRRLGNFDKHKYHYFPYDRVYFVPYKRKNIIKQLFRYSLILEVTDSLRTALKSLKIDKKRQIGLEREDEKLEWKETNANALAFLTRENWLMVIPTYAIHPPDPPEGTGGSKLAYVLSYAVTTIHNQDISLPSVQLQTPERCIPLMCSICALLPNYYANTCTPGKSKCRTDIQLADLPLDPSFHQNQEKSIAGQGETV